VERTAAPRSRYSPNAVKRWRLRANRGSLACCGPADKSANQYDAFPQSQLIADGAWRFESESCIFVLLVERVNRTSCADTSGSVYLTGRRWSLPDLPMLLSGRGRRVIRVRAVFINNVAADGGTRAGLIWRYESLWACRLYPGGGLVQHMLMRSDWSMQRSRHRHFGTFRAEAKAYFAERNCSIRKDDLIAAGRRREAKFLRDCTQRAESGSDLSYRR